VPILHNSEKCVVFCFIPGHCGSLGNEAAYAATEVAAACGMLVSDIAVRNDVGTCRHLALLSLWQDKWGSAQENNLHVVKPFVQEWHSSFAVIRKEKSHSCISGLVTHI
jgi:hypothetical protein